MDLIEKRPDLIETDSSISHQLEGGIKRAPPIVDAGLGKVSTLAVVETLLRNIDQLEIVTERPYDGLQLLWTQTVDVVLEPVEEIDLLLFSNLDETPSELLNALEGFLAGLGADDVAKQSTEVLDTST
jgi:hypothetical protein